MTAYIALVLGLLNILVGWLLHGGGSPLSSPRNPTQRPPTLVLAHLASVTLWLTIWISYLATDFSPILGWIGFALSLTINALGDTYLLTEARATTDARPLRPTGLDGALTPVITSIHPLSDAPAALDTVENGHAAGKVVIKVS
ncbi:zinc-binding dehydrogenase [Nocardia sp. NPDC055165]